MDRANISVSYAGAASLALFGQNDDCHKCALVRLLPDGCTDVNCSTLSSDASLYLLNTVYPWSLELRADDNDTAVWSERRTFADTGVYAMRVEDATGDAVAVTFSTTVEPSPSRIFLVIGLVLLAWLLSCFGLFFYKQRRAHASAPSSTGDLEAPIDYCGDDARSDDDTHEQPLLAPPPPAKTRVVSLDVFRGLTIVCMIFTNLGGGRYWFWTHATWNGLTPADVVFPWFVWIMGVTMNIGMRCHVKKGTSLWTLVRSSLVRAIKLFCLGLFVNNMHDLDTCRVPGVLQTFAFAYLLVTLIVVAGVSGKTPVQTHLIQAGLVLGVTAIYLGLIFFLPVPGCPTGYFGPGGDGDFGEYRDCLGGAHRVVDRYIFGDEHMLQGGTPMGVYGPEGPWDPEGFLNWLSASVLTYLGYVVGGAFLNTACWKRKTVLLCGAGGVSCLVGLVLCGFTINDGFIPINKNLWSLSFVCVTSGLACVGLCVMYLLVDKFGIWSGAPLSYAGMNAIVLYVGHETLGGFFPFSYEHAETHTAWTLSNLIGTASWVAIAYAMYRKKIFITV
ncbi:hypothetical protein SDRG_16557 [Saprolegnia diclina VS20]|uniref:Uncharacterized protein n=1 Tax=Saprolegnia diclina (strain VS20) TaxID=1156394 RepID=T0R7W6_SAPDV|nr:hypothetical protein SDRG_16557 [Saprolegnia diclina VS20]EQC25587.1 hypothetical protein SDRG_16557 [Saprolegnia diclina VS20]|eukprot:XP_008620994.1 hypothetical protein SDRG_16557 [Saprolegnia diclina VS20]